MAKCMKKNKNCKPVFLIGIGMHIIFLFVAFYSDAFTTAHYRTFLDKSLFYLFFPHYLVVGCSEYLTNNLILPSILIFSFPFSLAYAMILKRIFKTMLVRPKSWLVISNSTLLCIIILLLYRNPNDPIEYVRNSNRIAKRYLVDVYAVAQHYYVCQPEGTLTKEKLIEIEPALSFKSVCMNIKSGKKDSFLVETYHIQGSKKFSMNHHKEISVDCRKE